MATKDDASLDTKDRLSIRLRLANVCDLEPTFRWQTETGSRTYFRNPAAPTLSEHQAWFEKALADPSIRLNIVLYRDEPVGIVRLDDEGLTEIFEISILLGSSARGKGIGLAALKAAEATVPPETILRAGVRHGNDASVRLFQRAGYVFDADDGIEATYLLHARGAVNASEEATEL